MFLFKILIVLIALIISLGHNEEIYDYEDSEAEFTKSVTTNIPTPKLTQKKYFQVSDDDWISNALKDVSYYLRNFKFNEWDRRFFQKKPDHHHLGGYFQLFPIPSLRTIHWKVYDNCYEDFFKCLSYLHRVIETAPFTRNDDIITLINDGKIHISDNRTKILDIECKEGIINAEMTGLPFEGPLEKFKWRSSASYYMCWYTMLGIPALSMLGEKCDNFANCLDNYSSRNQDPRADDRQTYACAMYSFCPDPCCPLKHVKDVTECYEDISNPCFLENAKENLLDKVCKFDRSLNQNFEDLYNNKWNVTCSCKRYGYVWRSQYGSCVDINECSTRDHTCDKETQSCLNLPGNYTCVCKYGYEFNNEVQKCTKIKSNIHKIPSQSLHNSYFIECFKNLLKYMGF